MNTKSLCGVALLASLLASIASAQWKQANSGLTTYRFKRYDAVVVSAIPCANVYRRASTSDSIVACEPTGTTGMLWEIGSDMMPVSYSDGIGGYTQRKDLTHTLPRVLSFGIVGNAILTGTSCNAFRSIDSGASWKQTNSDFLCPYTDYWTVPRFRVIGGTIFAQNAYNPYFSTDSGATWDMIGSFFNFHLQSLEASRTCLFGMLPNGTWLRSGNKGTQWDTIACPGTLAIIDTILFAQHPDGQIDASFDNGSSWKTVKAGIAPPGRAWSLCSSGNYLLDLEGPDSLNISVIRRQWRDSTLVVMRNMYFPATFPSGVTSGSIAASGLYAMLDYGGTFFSTNSGDTWTSLTVPADVPPCPPFAVVGNYLFVGGTGVWRKSLDVAVSAAPSAGVAAVATLSQNYPNPFNPGTTIQYILPQRSRVTLSVYDPLGRRVATLVEGEEQAGEHSVWFDAGRLASGVYFYRLQAGAYVRTLRLLVVK